MQKEGTPGIPKHGLSSPLAKYNTQFAQNNLLENESISVFIMYSYSKSNANEWKDSH